MVVEKRDLNQSTHVYIVVAMAIVNTYLRKAIVPESNMVVPSKTHCTIAIWVRSEHRRGRDVCEIVGSSAQIPNRLAGSAVNVADLFQVAKSNEVIALGGLPVYQHHRSACGTNLESQIRLEDSTYLLKRIDMVGIKPRRRSQGIGVRCTCIGALLFH